MLVLDHGKMAEFDSPDELRKNPKSHFAKLIKDIQEEEEKRQASKEKDEKKEESNKDKDNKSADDKTDEKGDQKEEKQ